MILLQFIVYFVVIKRYFLDVTNVDRVYDIRAKTKYGMYIEEAIASCPDVQRALGNEANIKH